MNNTKIAETPHCIELLHMFDVVIDRKEHILAVRHVILTDDHLSF